jgi:hypothetical protein
MTSLTDDQKFKILQYANNKIGSKFSLLQSKHKYYCTKLISESFKSVGIDICKLERDLTKIRNIRTSINMAYEFTFGSTQFNLPKSINGLDLMLIGQKIMTVHQLIESNEFVTVANF